MTGPSAADREWLRLNWTPEQPTFRAWIAGSDRAHKLVLSLLDGLDSAKEWLVEADRLLGLERATREATERERDEYLGKLKHCLTAGETTARLVEEAKAERDEARKQLGSVLYLTKAPSTQALVDGYLEAARLREALGTIDDEARLFVSAPLYSAEQVIEKVGRWSCAALERNA